MSLPLHTFLHFGILSFVPEAAGVLATLAHPNHLQHRKLIGILSLAAYLQLQLLWI
ncbi:RNA polymerase subunit sigma-70 [Yersinia intermedia]|nr:RNA polymerase subunit sigma-70 [Yersinia sp. FDAARGOS_228]AVL37325.1 RNA polymerase subunit sigma-70 [Yersinia intermedia]